MFRASTVPPRPITPPAYAFTPARAPFIPPTLARDESTGSAFLADLTSVSLPATAAYTQTLTHACDSCKADLTGRPRVTCLDCRDYDACAECYIYQRAARNHRPSHYQKTLIPRAYPNRFPDPTDPNIDYVCDVCAKDLSSQPRARCTVCKNYDLCLDCKIAEQTSHKHRNSHDVNIIHSHYTTPPTPSPLMDESYQPSSTLLKIIDSLFEYINTSFPPTHTNLLTPPALSAFFSSLGLESAYDNIGRRPNGELINLYAGYGCEYYIISDRAHEIAARESVWCEDGLDTRPKTPALTRRGWVRWYVYMCRERPELGHFVTSNALSTGRVQRVKGGSWRFGCRRECFPRRGIKVAVNTGR